MISRELVDPHRLQLFFAEIEPELFRFPAIDPPAFAAAVTAATGEAAPADAGSA